MIVEASGATRQPGWFARKWKLLGPLSLSCCLCEIFAGRVLVALFRLDPWHGTQGFHCRSYKLVAAQMANALRPRTVVEVGCGLGDVLVHVDAARRYGIDIDSQVIRAASLFRGRSTDFTVGSIQEAASLPEDKIDLLIMLNWVHLVSRFQIQSTVRQQFADLFGRIAVSHVLLDLYTEDYAYVAADRRGQAILEMLLEFGGTIVATKEDGEGRILHLVAMRRSGPAS